MAARGVCELVAFKSCREVIQYRHERYDLTDFEWRVIEPLLPTSHAECLALTIAAC